MARVRLAVLALAAAGVLATPAAVLAEPPEENLIPDALFDVNHAYDQIRDWQRAEFGNLGGAPKVPEEPPECRDEIWTRMSCNIWYLSIQSTSQNERRFTLISNIMKTKHDTVRDSISNIR